MYKIVNNFVSYLNNKNSLITLTPSRSSFGNGAEEMLFGLIKSKKENKEIIFLYPRLKLFNKSFSLANREMFHLESNYLHSNITTYAKIGGCLISLYMVTLWSIDGLRKSNILRRIISFFFTRIDIDPQIKHGYMVAQIGRSEIWNPRKVKSFSWSIVKSMEWKKSFSNYTPPYLSKEKKNNLDQIRIKMGIPLSDWFVCLHVSEGIAPNKKTVRNASIGNYIKAIKSIVEAGGWVVRLGDSMMKPLPQMKRVIDYAHSPYKSELMDLYIINQCQFFIGLASGPTFVAALFDKPQILVNMTDWSMGVPLKKNNLILIKHVFSRSRDCFLSIEEIMQEPYQVTVFEKPSDEYFLVENTSDEIRDVVEEFLNHPDSFEYSSLQENFNKERRNAITRWINQGEPKWNGVSESEKIIGQYRIASRIDALGTVGNKYLEQNWKKDLHKKPIKFSL